MILSKCLKDLKFQVYSRKQSVSQTQLFKNFKTCREKAPWEVSIRIHKIWKTIIQINCISIKLWKMKTRYFSNVLNLKLQHDINITRYLFCLHCDNIFAFLTKISMGCKLKYSNSFKNYYIISNHIWNGWRLVAKKIKRHL